MKKVMILEDEVSIRSFVVINLKRAGYEVVEAGTGEEALERLKANPDVGVAILDIMLPDVDGFTLCREIRKKWFFPIIMLTAKIASSDKINGITFGADDYITKPFHPLELLARVKAQLRRAEVYNQAFTKETTQKEEIYNIRGLELNATEHSCHLYEQAVALTPIEFSIVLYLCRHCLCN